MSDPCCSYSSNRAVVVSATGATKTVVGLDGNQVAELVPDVPNVPPVLQPTPQIPPEQIGLDLVEWCEDLDCVSLTMADFEAAAAPAIARMNEFRALDGLPPLVWNANLTHAALMHYADMVLQGYNITHDNPNHLWGPGVRERARRSLFPPAAKFAENIATGVQKNDFVSLEQDYLAAVNRFKQRYYDPSVEDPHHATQIDPVLGYVGIAGFPFPDCMNNGPGYLGLGGPSTLEAYATNPYGSMNRLDMLTGARLGPYIQSNYPIVFVFGSEPSPSDLPFVDPPPIYDTCTMEPYPPTVETQAGLNPDPVLRSYTPEYSIYNESSVDMVNALTAYSQAVSLVTSQDPDGIEWIDWTGTEWNGVPANTSAMTRQELCSWLRPTNSAYVYRGLREKFYEVDPFLDPANPTPAEIDMWNIEVIRHFRALLGVDVPVRHNARLTLESRWSSERKYTESWDSSYPGALNSAEGPCWDAGEPTSNVHCGASFFPDALDRAPYISAAPFSNNFTDYPELENYTSRYAQTEGIASMEADIPWSIRLAFIIGRFICQEGLANHAGPYVGDGAREEFGSCWWYEGGERVLFRGKWR